MPRERDRFLELLTDVYPSKRDAERSPLRDLLAVIAEQVETLHTDIEGLYDDLFIEAGNGWAVPYLGDLAEQRAVGGRPTMRWLAAFARAAASRFEKDARSIPSTWWPRGLAEEAFAIRWRAGATGALDDERFRDATFRSLRGPWRAFRGVSVSRDDYDRAMRRARRLVAPLERATIADFDRKRDLAPLLALFRAVESIKATEAKWVSTSKTLHFVLPDLVPPIDNAFTVPFLRRAGVPMRPGIDREALAEVFAQLSALARLAGSRRLRELSRDPRYPTPVGMARVVDFAIAARTSSWRAASSRA